LKAKIQKFGNALSAMVMPNIGAFIAWGILAALFIPAGYIPNERLNSLVGPTLMYALPLLIGYTAGSNIYGRRGGVIGALATIGVVIGSDVTMLVGGMIMGPLAAFTLKKFDKAIEGKIRPGLEMLVDNFSLGIIGALLMILGLVAVSPIYAAINSVIYGFVDWAQNHGVIQLSNIVVVPAQLLFLNNAINHGIFSPIGLQQAASVGRSTIFLIESNGGPWTGLALAFCFFGKGAAKKAAPGVALIEGIGGIGETVFPFALAKPLTMLGPIIGYIFANYWFTLLGGGTVGPVSPGSFPALVLMSPKSALLVNISGYLISLAISFGIVAIILKRDKTEEVSEVVVPAVEMALHTNDAAVPSKRAGIPGKLENVYFCCDAGMGSSVMAAAILTTQLNKLGMSIKVKHASLSEVPADADLVVCSEILYERAQEQVSDHVPILKIKELMNQAEHKEIAKTIAAMAKEKG
jgi:PTS system mannitol-specific IIC component